MNHTKFSVSMCVYEKDNPIWFETAVESVLNQSLIPDEIVLVVDGPVTDELNIVIDNYSKNKIFKIIRLKTNQGHGNARRVGLENCSYNLVALMDADDISVYDRFEKQINFFENDDSVSIVGGNIAEFIDNAENVISRRIVPSSDIDIKKFIKKRCPMNQMTVMFKKNDIQSVGGYIDWYCNEDYFLWIRMTLNEMKFFNLSDTLVNVRIGSDMFQRRGGIKYFVSETKLQKYMLNNKIIGLTTFCINIAKRLIVQILLPNKIRSIVFKYFARKRA